MEYATTPAAVDFARHSAVSNHSSSPLSAQLTPAFRYCGPTSPSLYRSQLQDSHKTRFQANLMSQSAIGTFIGGSRSGCETIIQSFNPQAGGQGSTVVNGPILECIESALSEEGLKRHYRLPAVKSQWTALPAAKLERYSTTNNSAEPATHPEIPACTIPTPAAAAAPPTDALARLAPYPMLWDYRRKKPLVPNKNIGRIAVRLLRNGTFRGWLTGKHPTELTTDINAALIVEAGRRNTQTELIIVHDDLNSRLGIRLADAPTAANHYCRLVRIDARGRSVPSDGLQDFRGRNEVSVWTIGQQNDVTVSLDGCALSRSLRWGNTLYFTPGPAAASNPHEPRMRLYFEPIS